jgi:hypothetical protein
VLALCSLSACSVLALCLLCACSLLALCLLSACSLLALCSLSACSLLALCLLSACSVLALCLLFIPNSNAYPSNIAGNMAKLCALTKGVFEHNWAVHGTVYRAVLMHRAIPCNKRRSIAKAEQKQPSGPCSCTSAMPFNKRRSAAQAEHTQGVCTVCRAVLMHPAIPSKKGLAQAPFRVVSLVLSVDRVVLVPLRRVFSLILRISRLQSGADAPVRLTSPQL